MNDWLSELSRRLAIETSLVRVVVASVRGSAPRAPGTCMLIGAASQSGTIGGGHLELKATEIARQMIENVEDHSSRRLDRFVLGATLGQCCGGVVELWFERLGADDRGFVERALGLRKKGGALVLLSSADAGAMESRQLIAVVDAAGESPVPTMPEIAELLHAVADSPRALLIRSAAGTRASSLAERIDSPNVPLWLFGAGHVGKALVPVLAELPFDITWIDSRDDAFPAAGVANVSLLTTDDPSAEVHAAPRGACFLVMTHSHDLDYDICRAILGRDDFAWAGLIGSQSKAARFRHRLAGQGISAAKIERLTSPIGIDGIASKLPGAIAVSVAAQLLRALEARAASRELPAIRAGLARS